MEVAIVGMTLGEMSELRATFFPPQLSTALSVAAIL